MNTSLVEKIQHTIKIPLSFSHNTSTGELRRVVVEKTLQYTYDKRIVLDNYRTRPFGTKDV
jgi:hypothetical protein